MGRRAADVKALAAKPGQLGPQGLEAVDAALKDGQWVGVKADLGAALLDAAIERGGAFVAMKDALRVELAVVVGGRVVDVVRRLHAERPLHFAHLRRGGQVVIDVVAEGDPELVLRQRRKQVAAAARPRCDRPSAAPGAERTYSPRALVMPSGVVKGKQRALHRAATSAGSLRPGTTR